MGFSSPEENLNEESTVAWLCTTARSEIGPTRIQPTRDARLTKALAWGGYVLSQCGYRLAESVL